MKNIVVDTDYIQSGDFWDSDGFLKYWLHKHLPASILEHIKPNLAFIGQKSAREMNHLSMLVDKFPPQHVKRNFWGETIDDIMFHPAYWQLQQIALDAGLFSLKWDPEKKNTVRGYEHRIGFGVGFIYAMSEMGQYCPHCMTDGAARLLDRYAPTKTKSRLLPNIYAKSNDNFFSGAMFLTEKSGGSDVGANLVTATHVSENTYLLNGEKWFCSNANAEIAFVLARTNKNIPGTKGLSLFLVEKINADGSRNHKELVRIKEKLGVRSMASGEYIFQNTRATLIGAEFQGFILMTDMINLSRLYNAVAAIACGRRAIIEAYQYVKSRKTFGKNLISNALIQDKLLELNALWQQDFLLTFAAIEALDKADAGGSKEAEALARLLIPMAKRTTAQHVVYITRECMELFGGMGYIEDGIIPRLHRDALVLPIWEGSGNIILLDMLRAVMKSSCLQHLQNHLREINSTNSAIDTALQEVQRLQELAAEAAQIPAKKAFESLTTAYQHILLSENQHHPAIQATLEYKNTRNVSQEIVEKAIDWQLPDNIA